MTTTVYVPGDSAVRSIGGDDVARAIAEGAAARGIDVTIVRNGSPADLMLAAGGGGGAGTASTGLNGRGLDSMPGKIGRAHV